MNIVIKSLSVSAVTFICLQVGLPALTAASKRVVASTQAVSKALPLIMKSAEDYVEQKSCFTCHHQSLPVTAVVRAKSIGFEVDRKWLETQRKFTADFFLSRRKELSKGKGVPGGAFTAGYALAQFISTSHATAVKDVNQVPRLPGTDELLEYLLQIYNPERPWKINTIRPPLESSDFTATGLAVAALGTYEPEQLMQRMKEIRHWYGQTQAKTTEDRAFQAMGWYWLIHSEYAFHAQRSLPTEGRNRPGEVQMPDTQADAERMMEFIAGLRDRQREDGGWGQTDQMESDAYATGLVLTSLLMVKPSLYREKWVEKGVQYLIKNQESDGTWLVNTRSKPIQEYFESGFPHGEDQFISIAASCWSVIALSQFVESHEFEDN